MTDALVRLCHRDVEQMPLVHADHANEITECRVFGVVQHKRWVARAHGVHEIATAPREVIGCGFDGHEHIEVLHGHRREVSVWRPNDVGLCAHEVNVAASRAVRI